MQLIFCMLTHTYIQWNNIKLFKLRVLFVFGLCWSHLCGISTEVQQNQITLARINRKLEKSCWKSAFHCFLILNICKIKPSNRHHHRSWISKMCTLSSAWNISINFWCNRILNSSRAYQNHENKTKILHRNQWKESSHRIRNVCKCIVGCYTTDLVSV